jgi:hypothetical protein
MVDRQFPGAGEKKYQPQSAQEPESFFLLETKKINPFRDMDSSLSFVLPGIQTRR